MSTPGKLCFIDIKHARMFSLLSDSEGEPVNVEHGEISLDW